MRRNTFLLFAAVTFFMVSCSQADQMPEESFDEMENVIGFSVSTEASDFGAATRAEGEFSDISAIHDAGFGVFASYTGLHTYSESNVSSDFMYNEGVSYNSGRWTYSPLRYWPNGEGEATDKGTGASPHYVSFFAYAPYNDYNDITKYCIPSFSRAEEKGDPWIMYRLIDQDNLDKQIDLLYADPMLDQTKKAVNENVQFNFHHALACVGDIVIITVGDVLKANAGAQNITLTDVSVEYTLTEKAKLVLWNKGKANWQPIVSENITTTRKVVLLENGNETLYDGSDVNPYTGNGKGLFYIPLDVAGNRQKAEVHVTYTIGSVSVNGIVTIYMSDYTDAFEAGKKLDINITIDNE